MPLKLLCNVSLMSWLAVFVVAGSLLGPAASADQPVQRLLPVDEASQSPSFEAFRARLETAVAQRDTDALLRAVSDSIRISFGSGNGKAAFVRRWQPRDPQSPLWPALADILAHGGTFVAGVEPRLFCAPYVYAGWPASIDAFTHLAVTDWNVPARAAPAADAAVVAVLDYAIVRGSIAAEAVTGPEGMRWTRVGLTDGAAYVRARYLRSPVGYRACFQNSGDGWAMTVLIAGD